jgi:ribosomal protein L40E
VHRGNCDALLHASPAKFLAKLKPRGALLDASSVSGQASYDWLYFGFYMLAGLVFAALAAHRAFHVGRRPLVWLTLGLVGNLPAYAVLLALPKRQVRALAGIPPGLGKIASTYSPQACPKCGAENHPSALECSDCRAKLNPTAESEAARVGLRSP